MLSSSSWLSLGSLASLVAATLALNSPIANTVNGSYAGVHSDVYNQDYFLGIPFAQPPVGDLRFRQAQSLNTSFTETRNATEYSSECIGYGSDQWVLGDIVSEDCLTLNVVRPSGASSLPVAESVYARSPFIGVSINYRLQGWGYLFGQEIMDAGSANIGVRDQHLALRWIQENIAAFGGDPTKVTIWGESAGAVGVGTQLVAHGGRDDGLFRAAITQSGGPTNGYRYLTPGQWQPYYDKITNATNCSSAADSLDCLRKLPVDVLSNVLNSSVTAGATWGPQIDGDFLQESATTQVLAGNFVRVPLLTGRNHDEGTAYATKGINTTDEFLADVMSAGIENATALTIAALYPDIPTIGIPELLVGRPSSAQASLGAQWKRSASYAGDLRQHAARRLTTHSWAKYNTTAYSYFFNVFANGIDPTLGVTHFTEVAFVFNNIDGYGYNNSVASDPFANKPETYVQIAKMMSRMWASFIVDLNPNNAGYGCVEWPKYTLENPRNMMFDVNVTNLAYVEPDTYRTEAIAYMSSILNTTYGR